MYKIGDDVIVEFKGREAAGEVVQVFKSSGYLFCRIHIDPTWDYGRAGSALDPEPFICIRESQVSLAKNALISGAAAPL